MRLIGFIGLVFGVWISVMACQSEVTQTKKETVRENQAPVIEKTAVKLDTSKHHQYSWLTDYRVESMLVNQIQVPRGYQRSTVATNSFGDWLRHLPLHTEGTAVRHYDGTLKGNQDVHTRVVNIDTGKRDLQQCADAVMRLKAEYHFSRSEFSQIHFNFTSGDRVSFDDWRKGRKPYLKGNDVRFTQAGTETDNSYRNFKRYLRQIFSYAGTASLSKELQAVERTNIQIGDVFIQGGFPGHAVIVVDKATNAVGEHLFLLAQSYMPAQDIHILKNPNTPELSPWYSLNFGTQLETPEWTFLATDLMRFEE